ncbi:unnamed protein product, partial [Iphiclides podalirius]
MFRFGPKMSTLLCLGRPSGHRLGRKCAPPLKSKSKKGIRGETVPHVSNNMATTATTAAVPGEISVMEVTDI